MHAMPALPQSRPACQPFDTSVGRVAPSPSSGTTTRRPKPSSLRVSAIARASGDHANERCPGPHDGSACSCGFGEHGTSARRRRASTDPHVHPAVELGDERERVARRREPRLADRDVVATGDQGRRRVGIVDRDGDDPRAVPGHVREVPLVPRERAPVGRPGGIPRVVGVRDRAAAIRSRRRRRPRRRRCRRARARTRPAGRRARPPARRRDRPARGPGPDPRGRRSARRRPSAAA